MLIYIYLNLNPCGDSLEYGTKKIFENRDMKLVEDYIDQHYPGRIKWLHVRLETLRDQLQFPGMVEEEKRIVSVFKRYADAVILDGGKLILIEGAVMPDLGDVSKLLGYEKPLRQTPEFKQYHDFPVEKQLVLAGEDKVSEELAEEHGVKVIYFKPDWVENYLMEARLRTRGLRKERWNRLKRKRRRGA